MKGASFVYEYSAETAKTRADAFKGGSKYLFNPLKTLVHHAPKALRCPQTFMEDRCSLIASQQRWHPQTIICQPVPMLLRKGHQLRLSQRRRHGDTVTFTLAATTSYTEVLEEIWQMTDSTKTLMAPRRADILLMGQIVRQHVRACVCGVRVTNH